MDAMLSLVACGYFAHISFEENLTLCSKLKFEIEVKILQVCTLPKSQNRLYFSTK
jgi:hypothetical protein